MYKMYFDTGVRPVNRPYDSLCEHQEWKDGTMQIAFYLESEPPKGSRLSHLCDNVRDYEFALPVVGGGMVSKFAIFNVPRSEFYHVGKPNPACEYHPLWDYESEEEPDERIVGLVKEFFPELRRLAKRLGLADPTIYFYEPEEKSSPVGKCVWSLPNNVVIFLLNTGSHVGHPDEEVSLTLLHELGHRYIESLSEEDYVGLADGEEVAVELFAREYLRDADAAIEKLILFSS